MKKNLKYLLLLATVGVTVTTALWVKKQYNLLILKKPTSYSFFY